MLTGALIFLIIAVIALFFVYQGSNPTFVLVTKIIFYFSITIFFVLLFAFIVNSTPPIPTDNSKLPL